MDRLRDPLSVYRGVMDVCDSHAWTPQLGYDRFTKLWTLSVYARGELVARGRTSLRAPGAFLELGRDLKERLEKTGRLA